MLTIFEEKKIIQYILIIICIIFSLIYLEIIELHFCNLNLNLKKNISKREENENIKVLGINSASDSDALHESIEIK